MAKIPRWVPFAVLGAGVAVATAASVLALLPPPQPLELCRGWVNDQAPYQIRELAKPIEKITNLDGLGDFLAGVAWVESRGNPKAGSDAGNAARGWFGMRPQSARLEELGLSPSALKDGPTAVALAAWYAHRCQTFSAPGEPLDWLAVRLCWGKPSWTDDDPANHPALVERITQGLVCAGSDPDLLFDTPFGNDYYWPGVREIFDAVNRPLPAVA